MGNFEKFQNYQKIKKGWKLSKKFTFNFFFENFKKIVFFAHFRKFPEIFGFSKILNFFSKISPRECLSKWVHASPCLCWTRPLSHPVAACLGVCINRLLQIAVFVGEGLPYV
jgi:hypothetical protein